MLGHFRKQWLLIWLLMQFQQYRCLVHCFVCDKGWRNKVSSSFSSTYIGFEVGLPTLDLSLSMHFIVVYYIVWVSLECLVAFAACYRYTSVITIFRNIWYRCCWWHCQNHGKYLIKGFHRAPRRSCFFRLAMGDRLQLIFCYADYYFCYC